MIEDDQRFFVIKNLCVLIIYECVKCDGFFSKRGTLTGKMEKWWGRKKQQEAFPLLSYSNLTIDHFSLYPG